MNMLTQMKPIKNNNRKKQIGYQEKLNYYLYLFYFKIKS